MTQQLDVTTLPEYGEAMRKFQIEKGQAQSEGNELGVMQAERDLNVTLSNLKDRRFAAIEQQRVVEASRAAAAAKYPKVKPELYAHIQDPAQIEQYAASLQASIDEASGTNAQAAPEGAGSWGGAAPTSDNGASPRQSEKTPEEELAELRPVVMQKGRNALEQNVRMRQISAAPILDKIIASASQRAGFDIETGENLS